MEWRLGTGTRVILASSPGGTSPPPPQKEASAKCFVKKWSMELSTLQRKNWVVEPGPPGTLHALRFFLMASEAQKLIYKSWGERGGGIPVPMSQLGLVTKYVACFLSGCLQQMLPASQYEASKITCPTCDIATSVPEKNVEMLSKNFGLLEVITGQGSYGAGSELRKISVPGTPVVGRHGDDVGGETDVYCEGMWCACVSDLCVWVCAHGICMYVCMCMCAHVCACMCAHVCACV